MEINKLTRLDVIVEGVEFRPLEKDDEKTDMQPTSDSNVDWEERPTKRIRRPFSISEVEALVEAVETHGIGRWRDIKMRAFSDANHRTYVDLKDKWRTLVQTARISPQQRKGEAVPQELLDRVLTAQAYWSQYHSNNQKTSM